MKKKGADLAVVSVVALTLLLSVWLPEALTAYKDRQILDEIRLLDAEPEGAGYRYRLDSNEKVFILAECLNSRAVLESEQSALAGDTGYRSAGGTYAFVANRRGPSGGEMTDDQIYTALNEGIAVLKELNVLPQGIKEVDSLTYDAALYSAIDVPEPRNNVAVWKISLADSQKNTGKENRLIDAYLDADDGKIYEFYVRTTVRWEEIDPDALLGAWSGYMGLSGGEVYETKNPLLETTPYYKKYVFPGMGEEETIVTVGFYEGINELFLKISK